jgi:hypothetical protein
MGKTRGFTMNSSVSKGKSYASITWYVGSTGNLYGRMEMKGNHMTFDVDWWEMVLKDWLREISELKERQRVGQLYENDRKTF